MKIQYASDLHLEFYDNSVFLARGPFKVAGDVLVLAGDTLLLKDFDDYKKHRFFDWCAANYKETFLVPGNHEYYRDNVSKYPDSWEKKLRDNVTMYENRSVVVDDTEFILSTLWSHIPMSNWLKLKKGMSDFSLIKAGLLPLTATTYNALHERDLSFIKKAVSESKSAHKVVVTHHVPSRLLVAPEFRGSDLECGFTVDLTDYIASSNIDVWVYGHSHRSIEKLIGHTRIVSNQIGYVAYGEYGKNFSGDRFVDLDEEEFVPHGKGEVINLTNRYNGGTFLLQVAPDSPWFKLGGDIHTRLIGDPIEAFDPDGGPYVELGDKLSGRVVKEIVYKDGEILVKLI
jgi:predicted phosphodiesterase